MKFIGIFSFFALLTFAFPANFFQILLEDNKKLAQEVAEELAQELADYVSTEADELTSPNFKKQLAAIFESIMEKNDDVKRQLTSELMAEYPSTDQNLLFEYEENLKQFISDLVKTNKDRQSVNAENEATNAFAQLGDVLLGDGNENDKAMEIFETEAATVVHTDSAKFDSNAKINEIHNQVDEAPALTEAPPVAAQNGEAQNEIENPAVALMTGDNTENGVTVDRKRLTHLPEAALILGSASVGAGILASHLENDNKHKN